jgi:manganese/zinc/iron transport system substrate-binding protein
MISFRKFSSLARRLAPHGCSGRRQASNGRTPRWPRLATTATLLAAVALSAGCANLGERTGSAPVGDGEVKVVTTTNFITDTVRQIGGARVSVRALMGPGVDPHLYKASAGDVSALRDADVIFYGGLFLEAKMDEVFREIGGSRPVFAVAGMIPHARLLKAPVNASAEEEFDPHVWFDPSLWRYAALTVRDGLIEVDPEGAEAYRRNTRRFLADIKTLDRQTRRRLSGIPERQRVLVTSHDAFRYLGRRYGIQVAAIQGLSTAAEATTADIERIAGLVADRGVKAVFIESSVPRQTVEAVLDSAREKGQEAEVGGELYSDSAGELGTREGTYQGMFEANVDSIVEGLK